MSVSVIIVVVTVLISLYAFSNPSLMEQLTFNPYTTWHGKQWHRLFSVCFIHVDVTHLAFNMLALYSFGPAVEYAFNSADVYGGFGNVMFVIFYFLAVAAANLFNLFKYKDDYSFTSAGASGAVSAIMFAFILFYPNASGFSIFFIPLGGTPAWVIGIVFLVVSTFLANRQMGRVDHVAHFWGAVFGLVFPIIGKFWLVERFINHVLDF